MATHSQERDGYVGAAADPGKQQTERQRQVQAAAQRVLDWRNVMRNPSGFRVLREILSLCPPMATGDFGEQTHSAARVSGRRSVTVAVFAACKRADEDLALSLLRDDPKQDAADAAPVI